jgi:hypothetical protein
MQFRLYLYDTDVSMSDVLVVGEFPELRAIHAT